MKRLQELRGAESAEEDEENQKSYQDKAGRIQHPPTAADLSPTYEREEKKYAGEEKVVPEEHKESIKKEKSRKISEDKFEKIVQESKKEEILDHKEFVVNKTEEIITQNQSKEPAKVMDEMKPEKEDISKKVDIKTETSTTVLPGGEKTKTTVTTKTTEEGVEKTTLI